MREAKPGETSRPLPGGGLSHHDGRTNTTVNTGADHRVQSVEKPGLKASNFRPDGRAGHIERTRADGSRVVLNRGARGDRRAELVRPDGSRVVAHGRMGFVERPIRPGYVSRTYVVGGRTTVFVYRNYRYRGFAYYGYVPRVHYAPAFYGWAYRPWGVRVAYGWGWGPSPAWFYGGYFAPYPYYQDPAFWLTDYLMAQNLQMAYQSQQASASDAPPPPDAGMSPDQMQAMKGMIADEVRQQIQAEQAAAAQPAPPPSPSPEPTAAEAAPPALNPNQRTFVVAASLDVTVNGQSCTLTGGDVIYRTGDLESDGTVGVTVLNSKPGDCKANSIAAVEVATLQDMQNQFRQQIAAGMDTLASQQGKGSIPSGPAASPTQVAEGQAQPAPDAQTALAQLNQEADQTETEIRQAAAPPGAMLRPGPAGSVAVSRRESGIE